MKLLTGIALVSLTLIGSPEQSGKPDHYFQKENFIRYRITTTYADASWGSESTFSVGEVATNSSGIRSSTGLYEVYEDGKKSELVWKYGFAQDENKFYANTTNWCWPWYGDDKNVVFSCVGDSIEYPFNMRAGDKLKGGYCNRSMKKKGFLSKDSIVVTKRVVVGADTLHVPFGDISTWKITSEMHDHSVTVWDADQRNDERDRLIIVTEWFNPVIGVVKRLEVEEGLVHQTKEITMISYTANTSGK